LNEGDVGLMLKKGNLTDLIYGQVFSPWTTMVFDRKTAVALGRIANPIGQQVALVGDRTRLFQGNGFVSLFFFTYLPQKSKNY
jgi:hypothetical protein